MNTSTPTPQPTESRWGRPWFGGNTRTLIVLSVVLGLLLDAGLGWLFVLLEPADISPLAIFVVGFLVFLPFCVGLMWGILVDFNSLPGTVEDAEDSVESRWLLRAGASAFLDLMVTIGVVAGVLSFVEIDLDITWVLLGLFFVGSVDFGIRYFVLTRREG